MSLSAVLNVYARRCSKTLFSACSESRRKVWHFWYTLLLPFSTQFSNKTSIKHVEVHNRRFLVRAAAPLQRIGMMSSAPMLQSARCRAREWSPRTRAAGLYEVRWDVVLRFCSDNLAAKRMYKKLDTWSLTCPGQVVRQEKERTENLKLELDASNREENAIGTLPEDVSSRRKIVRKENGRNQ